MIKKINGMQLEKQYGGKTVLSCSLQVDSDGIFCIIGPNGSGKSTLLRIISLLEKPDSGELVIADHSQSFVNPFENLNLRRKIVLVSSHSRLFHDTVFNNVVYGLKLRKKDHRNLREQVERTVKMVGLTHKINTIATDLSSGEQQRTAIARALVLDPDVLFLDEPTVSLDPENTKLIENLILDWNKKEGKTIVLVTHSLFQAQTLSDFIIFMYQGKIVELSETKNFFRAPRTELGQQFISGKIY
ncbi:MAG: amino acid ABC transporter ATP-binding protein [SAR324 cluster bacterium]|nr:amino acid ABC transporter ATP-binding protein [SAR324 cluster bacterium]